MVATMAGGRSRRRWTTPQAVRASRSLLERSQATWSATRRAVCSGLVFGRLVPLKVAGTRMKTVPVKSSSWPVPVGDALLTTAYTHARGDTNLQSPWSGYPGYTSIQIDDFNRAGENAFLCRAGYEFPCARGLSAYALWVHGTTPDQAGQHRKDEDNLNLNCLALYPPDDPLPSGCQIGSFASACGQGGHPLNHGRPV